jgi:hypothetical protein
MKVTAVVTGVDPVKLNRVMYTFRGPGEFVARVEAGRGLFHQNCTVEIEIT